MSKARSGLDTGFTVACVEWAPRTAECRPATFHQESHLKGSVTKRLVYLMILGMFSLNFLTACNTVAGAGKDIEAAGDKIDDTATKEKND